MLRKTRFLILCLAAFFINTAFSANHHLLTPNMSVDFDFPPNQPQTFSNFLFWKINAECIVRMEEEVTPVSARATKRTSTVNGNILPKGETIYFDLKDQDKLLISAESGAEVELINLGKKTVKASCKTV